jgi:tRNA nucleotidyltransferase/poly(A) polymerase
MTTQRELAIEIVTALRQAGHQALFAGGCVRDLLLGKTPKDYDVATAANPEEVQKLFGHRRTRAVGASFGVVMVLPRRKKGEPHATEKQAAIPPVEVATFRKDGLYVDGRHPETVTFSTPEEDAQRRDFTINGMFFDPLTELVHDYVGGRADLEQRQLRAIGVAADRFREDKLRLLRAIRFNSILGFNIEPATWQAVMELAPEITAVSHERIAAELRRMLAHPSRHHSVQSLDESGLTQAIFESEVPASSTATLSALEALQTDSFETGMAVWLKDLPKPKLDQLCSHLKLSNQERDAILWLADQQTVWIEFGDWPIARQKRLLAHPLVHELVAMGEALTAAGSIAAEHLAVARGRLKVWSPAEINPPPIVTGEDLIHWGLRPSPQFRDILESLRDQQLEGQLSSMEDARHWLVRAGHLTQS